MLAFLFILGCFLTLFVIGCVLERTVPHAGANLFTTTPDADEQRDRADVAKARRVEAERRMGGAA